MSDLPAMRGQSLPTANDIARALIDGHNALQAAAVAVEDADMDLADAEREFTLAYERAYLDADGTTIPERQAQATLAAANAKWAKRVAEAKLRAAKTELKRIETSIDTARSLSALVRAEASVVNSGAT